MCDQRSRSLGATREVERSKSITSAFALRCALSDLTVDDLSRKETIFQIGLPPLRIDVITNVDGVEFAEAWPDRLEASFGGVCLPL
jgi:hypothetical protein